MEEEKEGILSHQTTDHISYDDIVEKIGSFGRFQKFWFLMFGMGYCVSCTILFDWVFIMSTPEFECVENIEGNFTDQCSVLNTSQPCTNFSYSEKYYKDSLVIRWNLICDRLWIRNTIVGCFFLGMFIGCTFIGIMADKFGRRFACRFATFYVLIFWLLVALLPVLDNYMDMNMIIGFYCVAKFGLGIGQICLVSVTLMQVTGLVGNRHRSLVNMLMGVWWGMGEVILVIFAKIITKPIILNVALVILIVPFVISQTFMIESVRWLLVEGRFDEAFEQVKKNVRWNRTSSIDQELWDRLVA
ncbi:hypothetical protein SNEBB_005885, partial [Seison nebaliae]